MSNEVLLERRGRVLLITQVAITLVMLVSAGLFLRTLRAALPIEAVWLDPQRVEISRRTGIGSRESFAANP